jgi:two-component sensor histidine kinase
MKKLIVTYLILLACFSLSCNAVQTGRIPPKAIEGVLDLSNWDFKRDGSVNLDGHWEFYWEQLLKPKDFAENKNPVKTEYINLPRPWNGYTLDGRKLPGFGYATFRLRILLNGRDDLMGLRVNKIFHAYRLWVDKELLLSGGVPGKNRKAMIPNRSVKISYFRPQQREMQIILQVSNFHHMKGGLRFSIQLGSEDRITWIRSRNLAFDMFLFGSLLIMTIYHFGLYYFRRSDRSTLYFGFFCLLFAMRSLLISEVFFLTLFPNFNWELQLKWEFLTYYLIAPSGTMFYYSLYPREMPRVLLRFVQVTSVLFVLIVILTPARIFSFSLYPYHFFFIFACFNVIYVLVMASVRKREGASLFLLGILLLILISFNDVLLTMDLIKTVQLIHFGFFIFIFFQAYVLSRRFSRAFTIIESQSDELVSLNVSYRQEIRERELAERELKNYQDHLEEVVKGRTAELTDANVQLQHEIVERKRAEEKIKTSLNEKEILLMEIHHRVKNNMQVISSLLNLQSKYIKDERDIHLFRDSQERVRSMALVHEKLYQSEDLTRIDCADYIKKLTHHLFHSYNKPGRVIDIGIDVGDIYLTIEKAIPCALIINELVSNSLKYAFTDDAVEGKIQIDFNRDEKDAYTLMVSDNGVGIPMSVNLHKPESLGLELVNILTKQINGNINLDRSSGTRYTISF